MKKGKGNGGIKGKGKKKSIPDQYFKTRYLKDNDGKEYRLHVEIPKIDRLEKKKSVVKTQEAINNPNKIPDERPKASVSCINEKRKAKGLEQITTPQAEIKRREIEKFVLKEADTYSKWAGRSFDCKEKCEMAYYSKLQHRKERALEYSATAHKAGPPKPKPNKISKGYSFANKDKVTHCNPANDSSISDRDNSPVLLAIENAEIQVRNDPGYVPSVAWVQWFINNCPPTDWPDIVKEYTYYQDSGYFPAKNKILKAKGMSLEAENESLERELAKAQQRIAELEDDGFTVDKEYRINAELHTTRLENGRLIQDLNSIHGKHELLEKQLEEAKEEIFMLKQELNFAHWEIAVNRDEDPSELQGVTPASYKSPPLALNKLATLFTVFKSQYNDNPLDAFCRIMNVPEGKRKELRALFDRQCEQRLTVSYYRDFYHRLSERNKVYRKPRSALRIGRELRSLRSLGNKAGYGAWLQSQAPSPEYRKACAKRKAILTVRHERGVFARWATTNRKLRCNKVVNNNHNTAIAKLEQRVIDLMNTRTYKFLKKAKDIALMEVNPFAIKRQRKAEQHSLAMKKKSLKMKRVKASRIKRELERKAEEQTQREKLREAYGIAH